MNSGHRHLNPHPTSSKKTAMKDGVFASLLSRGDGERPAPPTAAKGIPIRPNLPVSAAVLIAALVTASWARAQGDADLGMAMPATPMTHLAVGTVKSVDPAGRSATIDHRAIPSLNMPAMTMQFRLPPSGAPLKTGELIAFTFTASAHGLTIGSVQPVSLPADAGSARPRMDPSTPGMGHQGMQGMESMKGMMNGCPMMGGR